MLTAEQELTLAASRCSRDDGVLTEAKVVPLKSLERDPTVKELER